MILGVLSKYCDQRSVKMFIEMQDLRLYLWLLMKDNQSKQMLLNQKY